MNKFFRATTVIFAVLLIMSYTTLYWANNIINEQYKKITSVELRLERVCASLTTKQKHNLAFGGCTFIISKE